MRTLKGSGTRLKISSDEHRSLERLRYHYAIEKELGDRIRNANKEDRLALYRSVYDELFQRVSDHPQVTAPNRISHEQKVASQLRLVEPFLDPEITFLEIGGGDCALSFAVAPLVKQVYGVEITDHLIRPPAPRNFQMVLSNGSSIALPPDTVDVAFSFSVVEHVHSEDFIEQLAEVHRVLKPGGVYYCVTPNGLLGPHDISGLFDDVPTGLHMKEYTVGELAKLYRSAGFGGLWVEKRLKSHRLRIPVAAMQVAEGILEALPRGVRTYLASSRLLSWAMEVCLIGRKRR